MNMHRMKKAAISVAALSLVAAGAALTPANAADHPIKSAFSTKTISTDEGKAAVAYWTPERMKNAKSAESRVSNAQRIRLGVTTAVPEKGAPQVVESTAPASAQGPQRNAANENTVPNIGKVFFKISGDDYVCSGNVVSSSNGSTVSTAGHCVNEGPGGYYTDFVFVPAYNNGAAPYGRWPAERLTTTSQWANNGDFNYDTAFVKLSRLNNQTVASQVGSSGVGFNLSRGLTYKAFGYPHAAPFDGQTLKSCSGTAHNDQHNSGATTQGITCDMTGGSSGGPWFTSTNPQGTQNSVNSYGYDGEKPPTMYGPYWGSVIQSLYNQVQAS